MARAYRVRVRDDKTGKEETRLCVDAGDLLDEMLGLELVSFNVLENWFDVKFRLVELLRSVSESGGGVDKKK